MPGVASHWHTVSNTVVLLAAPDEAALRSVQLLARAESIRAVGFYEPDLGDALTAVALEPAAGRVLAHLPLALSARKEVNQ